jgi:hypothetical protein
MKYPQIQRAQTQEPIGSVADTDLQGFISGDYSHILVYPKDHYTNGGVDVYPAPQKREWVGLTDDEIAFIYCNADSDANSHVFARAIEAKLKEKNT